MTSTLRALAGFRLGVIVANLGFLPSTDAGLLAWSVSFSSQITSTPTVFGLTAAQATAYAAVHATYATAYATATNESTRTKGTVAAKNTAKAALKSNASNLAGIIEHTAGVTNQQKVNLGLNVRAKPTPVPPPSTAPALSVISVSAWTAKIKLKDSASGSKRGKPAGVIGASIFSYVGTAAPTDMAAYKFEGNTGLTTIDVAFANTLAAGTQVWLTAFWFNGRKQSGPACAPVSANLPGGSVSMAA